MVTNNDFNSNKGKLEKTYLAPQCFFAKIIKILMTIDDYHQHHQNHHDDYHQHDHQVRILGDPDIHVNEGSSLRLDKLVKELKKKKRRRKEGSPIYLKITIYCPQGSGTLRQQLLMMH